MREREEGDSCDFLRENERNSGDDDSNSDNYNLKSDHDDSKSGDGDSSSSSVLSWCSLFIYYGIDNFDLLFVFI